MSIPRRSAVIEVGDDTIAYDACGEPAREAVVLLHGSGGNRATWWPVVPLLARDHYVVTVDLRGHGRSTDTAHALGSAAVAQDLEALRGELDIDRWWVVGHSLGGYLAMGYASRFAEHCRGVASVASIGGVMTEPAQQLLASFAKHAATWSAAEVVDSTASLSPAHCAAHPEQAYLYQLLRALNPPLAMDTPAVRMEGMAVTPDDLRMPVLYVGASADPLAPAAVLQSCVEALPDATYVEMAAAGHVCFWEQPQQFCDILLDWLTATAPA